MTRNDRLMCMKGCDLISVADKLGVKVACNKSRTQLKESKQAVIDRIIAKEQENALQEVANIPAQIEPQVVANEAQGAPGSAAEHEEKPAEPVKKERKSRKKKEFSEDVSGLLEFITSEWRNRGGIVKMPNKEGALFRPLCAENGRQVVKLMWTTKKVSLFVRVESVTEYAEDWQKINYALPFQCMYFHNNEEIQQNLRKFLESVMEIDSVRITKKMLKEQAKAENNRD